MTAKFETLDHPTREILGHLERAASRVRSGDPERALEEACLGVEALVRAVHAAHKERQPALLLIERDPEQLVLFASPAITIADFPGETP
jgi:hypothetical protein